jgi:hypothetical protein
MDSESELFKEMAKLDKEILKMIDKDPDLAEVYSEEMGEQPGDVVYLPRSPTKEEWALALKRSKQGQNGSE